VKIKLTTSRPDAASIEVDLAAVPGKGDFVSVDEGGELPAMYRVEAVYWGDPAGGVALAVTRTEWPSRAPDGQ
jgi:hypothetical protein